MNERKIFVSSDIVGMWQNIGFVHEIYSEVMGQINGIELLALGDFVNLPRSNQIDTIKRKIALAHTVGFREVSLHGRTNSAGSSIVDKGIGKFIDSLMPASHYLVQHFGSSNGVLVHIGEAKREEVTHAILTDRRLPRIWIENDHPGLKSFYETIKFVSGLRQKGAGNVRMMWDPCHMIGANNLRQGNYKDVWEEGREYVYDHHTEMPPFDFHVPLGKVKHDSLDLNNPQATEVLCDMAQIAREFDVKRIVIEDQFGPRIFGVSSDEREEDRGHVNKIFDALHKTGLAI